MPLDDLVQRPALPELEPDRPVAALGAGAGGHQVTDTGQAAEGEHLAPQRDAETAQLGQAPGDQHRTRVLAESQPVTDAGGNGHHVLRRPGDLAADDVGAHVDAKRAGVHQVLDAPRQDLVGQGDDAGGGLPLGHLPGQIRAGQDPGRDTGKDLRDDLGHAEVGPRLNALGQADDGLDPRGERPHSSSTPRNPWEGTAMNTTPAPRSASSREDVAASPSGRLMPGR